MVDARLTTGVVLVGAGLAILWSVMPRVDGRPAMHAWSGNEPRPVAALAWVQANCATDLKLAPDTPRLEAEDFIRSSGDLDRRAEVEGRLAVCRYAERVASAVAFRVDDIASRNAQRAIEVSAVIDAERSDGAAKSRR